MKKFFLFAFCFFLQSSAYCIAQDLSSHIKQMKSSYAASGSIVALNDNTFIIEPNMPGPLCAVPSNEGGKTSWSVYTFPLASITVPLAVVDESLIGEDVVFTDPKAPKAYKPGDVGDTTMVLIVGVPGKQFHTLRYDRDKLANLGPGPHDSSAYGQASDDVEVFGLTFQSHDDARAFETALRNAVIMAKTKTVAKAQMPSH
jgi:hypothetical protein